MIVYIETNFVLELALQQEEFESCQELLTMSASGAVALVVPAYAMVEPLETLVRRDKSRKQLAERVGSELRQLGRSALYRHDMPSHETLLDLLMKSGDDEIERFVETRSRLVELATIIPLNQAILMRVPEVRANHGLSQQDAVIFASVLEHLEGSSEQSSCFITKNAHDFSSPDVDAVLGSMGCKLLFRFQDGVGYATHARQTLGRQVPKMSG